MSELTQYIQCDIEMEMAGPSEETVAKWAADVLRGIADKIEGGGFSEGHHDILDKWGKTVGTAYFDFTEGFHVSDEQDPPAEPTP